MYDRNVMGFQIHVHENLESLYEYVPKDILPQEYGGNAGPIDAINSKYSEWS